MCEAAHDDPVVRCVRAGLVLVTMLAACARPSTPPPARAETSDVASVATPEPAAGRRAYAVERLLKSQAIRIDAHTVRGPLGIPLEIVREDAEAYEVKRYPVAASAPADAASTAPSPGSRGAHASSTGSLKPRTSSRLRFRSFGDGLPKSGQWRDGFAIADMNGDGHPDLVHGPARKAPGTPVIFLGDGHGAWRRWAEARFPPRTYEYGDAQVGDVNGDGHPDVVLAMHLRGLGALTGDGRGGFADASDGLDFNADPAQAGFSSRAIRLTDWDGDGRLDILALGEGPRLVGPGAAGGAQAAEGVVAYVHPGPRWERRDGGDRSRGIFGSSLALGDFDGDGRLDVATASGTLGNADIVSLHAADGGWAPTTVPVPPQSYVRAVAARDFDGDRRADLVVAYLQRAGSGWRTGLDVLFPHADGAWDRRSLFAEDGKLGIYAAAGGDLDGDGNGDIVALTGDGDALVFTGDGHGAFARETGRMPRFPGSCQGAHVELADLDGDGRDEVIASFAEEHSSVAAMDRCPSGGGISAWKVQ